MIISNLVSNCFSCWIQSDLVMTLKVVNFKMQLVKYQHHSDFEMTLKQLTDDSGTKCMLFF